jgi:hypothetical protein
LHILPYFFRIYPLLLSVKILRSLAVACQAKQVPYPGALPPDMAYTVNHTPHDGLIFYFDRASSIAPNLFAALYGKSVLRLYGLCCMPLKNYLVVVHVIKNSSFPMVVSPILKLCLQVRL